MKYFTRAKNAVIVAGFCILLAGNVASMEKNEYRFVTTESETENIASEMQEQAEEIEYHYPIILTSSVEHIQFIAQSEDIFVLCGYDHNYGYMKKTGEEFTGYIYEEAYPFTEGLACVKLNGKYGYIDSNGETVLPFEYDDAAPFQEGLAYFVKDGHYGYMKPDGSVAFYVDYDSVSSFSEGLAYFSVGGKYGYMDTTGNIAIVPSYSDADYFKDGIAFVMEDGMKGAIDKDGNVVIPLQYGRLWRLEGGIVGIIGEQEEHYDYYDLNGVEITKDEYNARTDLAEEKENSGLTSDYNYGTDIFIITDEAGNIIFEEECWSAGYNIYGDNVNRVLSYSYNAERPDQIVLIKEDETVNLSGLVLKNAITPKIDLYWRLAQNETVEIANESGETRSIRAFYDDSEGDFYVCQKTTRLFDIDGSGNPILYCYEAPHDNWTLPWSYSNLFLLKEGELHWLVSGYECGGSSGGDVVCFWKDEDTGEILFGTDGHAGGFGGFGYDSTICRLVNGTVEEILDCYWTYQSARNYDEEVLLATPHLFYTYDENETPYTKETILEADSVQSCVVNDERVSLEEYREIARRYSYVSLFE